MDPDGHPSFDRVFMLTNATADAPFNQDLRALHRKRIPKDLFHHVCLSHDRFLRLETHCLAYETLLRLIPNAPCDELVSGESEHVVHV
jgi:hypothetical protein